LLTAQLQAQDPLNPMDPNQMVGELTSMNTLQQIIQIRQDLDTLAGTIQPTPAGGNSRSGSSSPATTGAISQIVNQPLTASSVANSTAALHSHAVSKF
jgi:flagellar hook assembly protein FlgD